jgi:hypothetical protein
MEETEEGPLARIRRTASVTGSSAIASTSPIRNAWAAVTFSAANKHLQGAPFANQSRQPLGSTPARNQSEGRAAMPNTACGEAIR